MKLAEALQQSTIALLETPTDLYYATALHVYRESLDTITREEVPGEQYNQIVNSPDWRPAGVFDELKSNTDQQQIDALIKDGHSDHCAKRQVWGDGECECHLYKEGYLPDAWMDASTAPCSA